MATVAAAHRPDFLRESSSYFLKNHHNFPRIPDWTMRMNPQSSQRKNREDLSIELQKLSFPHLNGSAIPSELRFDQLQPAEQVSIREHKIEFGDFVVREAVLDEEFWTAAWLRAETHWEGRSNDRYADNYKRKFTEQEFNALKRRCNSQIGQKYSCIVTVKKDQININHTGLKSVVGTLDLSIGNLLHGANFPGERVKASLFCSINKKGPRYGYIANLCVSQSARRQGIASNMLNFAIRSAKLNGAEQVFVHVHKNNKPAQDLYQKLGFEVVEIAGPQFSAEQTHLLRFTIVN